MASIRHSGPGHDKVRNLAIGDCRHGLPFVGREGRRRKEKKRKNREKRDKGKKKKKQKEKGKKKKKKKEKRKEKRRKKDQ